MVVVFGSEDEAPPDVSVGVVRRRLTTFLSVVGILALGVMVGWTLRDWLQPDPTLVPVGSASDFPVGSVSERVLDIGYFDPLGVEGLSPTEAGGPVARTSARLFIVNDPDVGIIAFSQISPFLGCRIVEVTRSEVEDFGHDVPPAFQRGFLDACHGGLFSLDGQHLAGPGERGLDRFPVHYLPDGTVAVDLTRLQSS